MLKTANAEPIVAKLRNARDAPRCKKSKIETEDPNREIPKTENPLPMIPKLRKDTELPKCP